MRRCVSVSEHVSEHALFRQHYLLCKLTHLILTCIFIRLLNVFSFPLCLNVSYLVTGTRGYIDFPLVVNSLEIFKGEAVLGTCVHMWSI